MTERRFPRNHWAHHHDVTVMDVIVTILRDGPNFTEALAIMVEATDAEIAEILGGLEHDGTISSEIRDYGSFTATWWRLADPPNLTP